MAGLQETIAAEFWLLSFEASGCEAAPCPPDAPHHGFPADGRTTPPFGAAAWLLRRSPGWAQNWMSGLGVRRFSLGLAGLPSGTIACRDARYQDRRQ